MSTLLLYTEAIAVVAAAGDAITRIVYGVKHLVVTGASGYNYLAAQRQRDRLIELSARATDIQVTSNVAVIRSLDEYLGKRRPSASDWMAVQESLAQVLEHLVELLDDVRHERSDFVLEEAYRKLLETTSSRAMLAGQIGSLPPPSNDEERRAVRQLTSEYKRMLACFGEAVQQLNEYLKRRDDAD
jgi:hypothetical protein